MPGFSARSATPSTFQKAVAAATRPASERGDGAEADRGQVDLGGIAAGAGDDGAQHRVVGREAGDARALALQVGGRAHLGLGQHRGERALHERHHADDVLARLAREPEVVDVEDGEVGPAAAEQLERVGRGAGLADRERHALRPVELAVGRHVDAGVHGVRREVEQERRLRPGAVLAR